MSGFAITKKFNGSVTIYATSWAGTDVPYTSNNVVSCKGYNKLMVYFSCSSGWNRAGTITIYGSLAQNDTFTALDSNITNATYNITTSSTGGIYVVDKIPPYIKLDWNNTTEGTTGTLTVKIMPFVD